jgi:hypothetical protein
MPRDGSGVYTQPFPDVVAGTTIESAKYNGNVNDVEQDLNTPRPIVAGGTAANNAVDAAINLGLVSGKTAIVYTDAEKTQARSNIYAAPLDALAYSGMQINGAFDVNQEGDIATVNQKHFCDGWKMFVSGAMVVGAAVGNAPGLVPGLPNLAALSVSTAAAALAAGDYVAIAQYIEGSRIARLGWGGANAQPITLAFWSSHFRTGLYSGTIRNGSSGRSYPFTYTQVGNTVPQYNVITIPGDTAGTWAVDNTAGMIVTFAIATGANFTAPSANNWLAGAYHAAPGQVNGVTSISDVFRLWGVVVLPGSEPPSAARSALITRPYDRELVTCQRYFFKCTAEPLGWAFTNNTPTGFVPFRPPMRAAPTLMPGATFFVGSGSTGTPGTTAVTPTGANIYNTAANWTVQIGIQLSASFDARL